MVRPRIAESAVSIPSPTIPTAKASRQAGQLPPGPSPESFAPHCEHVVSTGTLRSFYGLPPVTAENLRKGYRKVRCAEQRGAKNLLSDPRCCLLPEHS